VPGFTAPRAPEVDHFRRVPPPVPEFQRRRPAGAVGEAPAEPVDVAETFQKGLVAFREERWREGYDLLSLLAERDDSRATMPPVFFSYLGLGMAHCDRRKREGLELCRYALEADPNNHENYLNAALVYLMLGRRDAAYRAVSWGLEMRPGHPRLLELQRQIGVRQKLTFPSLSRRNPLNSVSGRVRALFGGDRRRRSRAVDETEQRIDAAARARERTFAQLAKP
jgi:tetratricopeptide (TPR) repeat protein